MLTHCNRWQVCAWVLATSSLATPALAQGPLPASAPRIAWDLPVSLAALDSTNGIGPIAFGMGLPAVPLVLTDVKATSSALVGCRAASVALVIDGLRLYGGIILVAYRGHVAKLNLGVSDVAGAEPLLATLRARYGPGKEVGYQTVEWVGAVVTLRYVPIYVRPSKNVLGSLYLLNNDLVAQEKADKAATRRH